MLSRVVCTEALHKGIELQGQLNKKELKCLQGI